MARLIVNPGTSDLREIRLKDGVNTVGRGDANDAVIHDASISGHHCEVIVAADSVRLKDLGSTNGTFINRLPVTEATLQSGQTFQLGGVHILFESDVATKATSVTNAPVAVRVVPQAARLSVAVPVVSQVRVATPAQAPAVAVAAAEASPPEAPPIPVAAVASNAACKFHPKSPARWLCPQCHKTYCEMCVTTRPSAGTGQKFCRTCAIACTPLQVSFAVAAHKTFFGELPRSFIYPFRGTGIMILIAATLLFAALDFMSAGIFGLLMKAVALGYLFSYVQNIIHSTASDDDRMPDLPGMDDVLGGFFRLLGTMLISFGPAALLAYLAIAHEMPMAGIALIPAVIFGCLYFPMAFLAVAIKDNVMAANPLVVVPAILRVPLEYLVTAILLAGLFGIRWLGDALTGGMAHQSLMTSSMTEMFVLFGLRAFWAFMSVYLLTVTIRILGLLYLTKRDRFGW